jgi:hypothetical protein
VDLQISVAAQTGRRATPEEEHMQLPAQPQPTGAFAVDDVDALIAQLEAQTAGEIDFTDQPDPWPSEICTGRATCILR